MVDNRVINSYGRNVVKNEKLASNSSERRKLVQLYNDGKITLEEYQIELSVLNSVEKT